MEGNGSPFEFPSDIPVKVFGRNDDAFREAVLTIVRRHFVGFDENTISTRLSRQDRYQSITLNVRAETRGQIDALYTELSRHEAILMVL